ncbi:subtilisin-like serine protease [Halobacteroides halobius DSM 5150]|uniref:Subtilisin-like serine protease n=1 Tax=Halobacteroides halobius (strain ATCC 35273 / DSM 5150 / MD-1) TaxID=748449 RepID=L0KCQ2_HALHC|nr:peptidase S8 [Halobacteroides halobius]AGB42310.1 subtilisin-like serine protease [Halobacteroides halobius DSM 5150]
MKKLICYLLVLGLTITTFGCSFLDKEEFVGVKGHVTLTNTKLKESTSTQQISTQSFAIKGITSANSKEEYVQDEILVSFEDVAKTKVTNLLAKYGLTVKRELHKLKIKVLKVNSDYDLKTLIEQLNNEAIINYAELNRKIRLQAAISPNDPGYSKQWNYKAISLPQAWDVTTGSKEVTVAVIDTGVDLDHPDLEGQLDLKNSVNVINSSSTADDDHGHGTHVAGILGAVTDNGRGVAGINWNIKIMPIKVFGATGSGNYSNLITGIYWAVNNHAEVINLSLGGSEPTSSLNSLKVAVEYAYNKGVTVVAAAGNGGEDMIGDLGLLYPAHYPSTIAVGAVNSRLERANFSNYGANLDFVAPGSYIYSTVPPDLTNNDLAITDPSGYKYAFGTSMATPHVAGLAALLIASGQANTPAEVKRQLRLTAQDLGVFGRDKKHGFGLINAYAGVKNAKITKTQVFAGKMNGSIINRTSQVTYPVANGFYSLANIEAGSWYLYGWIDVNNNNLVDKGDYFGKTDSRVSRGLNVNLNLSLITDKAIQYQVE